MSLLAESSRTELFSLFGAAQKSMEGSEGVDQASQRLIDTLYARFQDSLALARLYVTVPYQQLPATNQTFVQGLAKAKQIVVQNDTPVLSLMGTRGAQTNWNDRKKSEGHIGIPLVSLAFVKAIPMVARLLSDLGVPMEWIDRPTQGVDTKRNEWSGLFHVADATTTVDQHKRHVIPAQDFVKEQSVRTVFGIGSSFPNGSFFALILFTREDVPKDIAERFLPLATNYKLITTQMAQDGKYFQQ
jgi:hypothetical protein